MFSTEGKISVPDATLALRLAPMAREGGAARDASWGRSGPLPWGVADEMLYSFAISAKRAWLISVDGQSVEVGNSFIYHAFDKNSDFSIMGRMGITRQIPFIPDMSTPTKIMVVFILLFGCIGYLLSLWPYFTKPDLLWSSAVLWEQHIRALAMVSLLASLGVIGMSCLRHYSRKHAYGLPTKLQGLALVFDQEEFAIFLERVFGSEIVPVNEKSADGIHCNTQERFDTAALTSSSTVADEKRASEYIVASWRGGGRFTKGEMRSVLMAPEHPNCLGSRAFERAWAVAREVIPALGKPGRKEF